VFVADSSFAAIELLDKVSRLPGASLVTRLRMDAALYDPAPVRMPGTHGRPRLKGKRRPTLQQVLSDPQTKWERVTIENWYGEGEREVEVSTETAVWYHHGKPPVPIRWFLICDPGEKFEPQALLSTNLRHTAAEVLKWFVCRWTMEVTLEEARAHLGLETLRTMLQNAPIGARHKRAVPNFEYNIDLSLVYFDPSHHGSNDFTSREQVRRSQTLLHSFGELLELPNNQMQFVT
jgi:DDE superfamily endonuclease